MYVKKVRKKCRVRGCKNVADVYVISKRKEMSNTLIMCRECMKEAFESTAPIEKEVTTSEVDDFTKEVETNASTKPNQDDVSNIISTSAEDVVTSAETTEEPKPIATPKPKTATKSNKKLKKK